MTTLILKLRCQDCGANHEYLVEVEESITLNPVDLAKSRDLKVKDIQLVNNDDHLAKAHELKSEGLI